MPPTAARSRPLCIAPSSSTPSPRSAPYHSPNTAPAIDAGAASFNPSMTDGQHAGSCNDHSRNHREPPSAVTTSWLCAATEPRPMLVETNTKKKTAIAATAIGPRSRPRMTSRHGPTATHGAALAMVANREIERRSDGMDTAASAETKANVPPIANPRAAAHTVDFVARM